MTMSPPAPVAFDRRTLGYAPKMRHQRLLARQRIHDRVVHPISTPHLLRDPLVRPASSLRSSVLATRMVGAALLIHSGVLIVFLFLNRFLAHPAPVTAHRPVQVHIREVPPAPDLPEPVEEPGPVPEDFPPKTPTPKPKQDVPRVEAARNVSPQSEPKTLEPESQAPKRRIVGLSFESTVQGGPGKSFATGTSRMGQTATTAQAPETARLSPSGGAPGSPIEGKAPARQRVASHIPTRDVAFTKPRRATPSKPTFPPALRARGIEGDVVVSVTIAADGHVTHVGIVKSSGYPAFDRAAQDAASAEKYVPAERDGQAIPFTLTFSYRFRIED